MSVSLTLAALLLAPALQDAKKGGAKVDQIKVDQAISKGVAYLKGQIGKYGTLNARRTEELILWTLVHAGLPDTDPDVQALLKTVTETPLQWTYNVSLQAMILEEIDRVKWQPRIAECAQFLVDNQCANGQWAYGSPTETRPEIPSASPKKDVASGGTPKKAKPGPPGTRTKPKVLRLIPIKKGRDGPATGDHSNAQYAALGLRACHEAGLVLPEETLARAEKAWRDTVGEEGGWGYLKKNDAGYGSMTAGAVGAILIYDAIAGRAWMKDREVVAGLEWLARKFSVTANPDAADGEGAGWHFYFLYALERAGIFYGTEKIGTHEWYPEGATFLLGAQAGDGSWQSKGAVQPIWDTCFAVLFLRRATRPLTDVASVDRFKK